MDPSIAAWMAVLDKVSFYELLGVQPAEGPDAVRRAYQAFAANFHPDAHVHRTPEDRAAVNSIFKRGTEAYRVLSDPLLRSRYEEQRTGRPASASSARNAPLPPSSSGAPPSSPTPGVTTRGDAPKPGSASKITGRLEEFVRQPRARPFAQQAEALAKKGEHGKAKLQLKLAMNFDQGNEALEAYLRELDSLIEAEKRKPFVPK